MKSTILTLIIALVGFLASAQELDMKRIAFVNEFCVAVADHDEKKVIKMTDQAYSSAQIEFLGGNKTQFVDELFGGVDIFTDEYVNTKFEDILKLEIVDVVELEDGNFEYIFYINIGQTKVERHLLLIKTGKKYGFIGSQG